MRYSMELSALSKLVRQKTLKEIKLIADMHMTGKGRVIVLCSYEMLSEISKHLHGSSAYTNGCRCSICRESRKLDLRKWRKNKKENNGTKTVRSTR
jgi:hypothetical protein